MRHEDSIFRLQVLFLSRFSHRARARICAPECRFYHELRIEIVNNPEIYISRSSRRIKFCDSDKKVTIDDNIFLRLCNVSRKVSFLNKNINLLVWIYLALNKKSGLFSIKRTYCTLVMQDLLYCTIFSILDFWRFWILLSILNVGYLIRDFWTRTKF